MHPLVQLKKVSSIAPISSQDAAVRHVTRRRFLETSVIAGAGTLLGTAAFARAQRTRLVDTPPFYKGMCYSAFPSPYNPSTANKTCIFSGSDIANKPMEPLWGRGYMSASGMRFPGRDDVRTMKQMGVTLVRLYDWAPRDRHLDFLNYCHELGIKVLAPVSNYFLIRGQGFENRETHIPNLIRSFSTTGVQTQTGTDYHPAIAAIVMGNEPRISGFTVAECVQFTKDWVRIEQQQFPGFSMPPIAHPVDFHPYGGRYPAWGFFTPLLEGLSGTTTRNLQSRLILAPNTFNDAFYLFDNAESSGKGYVQLTYEMFHKPLLFTELGNARSICSHGNPCQLWVPNPNYLEVVDGQLKRSIAYGMRHPEQLLGSCHFQFDDKVWLCPTGDPPGGNCPSEGAFGVFSHTNTVLFTVNYVPEDFTIFDSGPCDHEQLEPDQLTRNPTYEKVVNAYT